MLLRSLGKPLKCDITSRPFVTSTILRQAVFPKLERIINGEPLPEIGEDTVLPPSTSTDEKAAPPAAKSFMAPVKNRMNQALSPESLAKSNDATEFRMYVMSTRNNNFVTFTRPSGLIVKTVSAGLVGYKGSNKSSYEAGYQCATEAMKSMTEWFATTEEPLPLNPKVHLLLSGFGRGREAILRALQVPEHENIRNMVCRLTDRTPLKRGGTKPKKKRRL
jgi:small subunit ribosomal protein S11